jgi:hypothetical protein
MHELGFTGLGPVWPQELRTLVTEGFEDRDLRCIVVRGDKGIAVSCARSRAEVAKGITEWDAAQVGTPASVVLYMSQASK